MRRRGEIPEATKKYNAGTNKQQSSVPNANKLLESDNPPPVKRIGHKVGSTIQKSRSELGMNQKQLAEKICVKPTLVADYESGNAVVDQAILSRIERVLKIHLRGNHIGEPIVKPVSKSATK